MRRESLLLISAALGLAVLSGAASGQSTTQVAFAPGSQELFALDFARAPIGGFRSTIELPRGTVVPLTGNMAVVTKNGRPMLRATEHSELLISLPNDEKLPQNFTIEVDIVPRDGGPEPDLTLEGTRSINQDAGSAHLRVTTDASFGFIQVVGGGTNVPELAIPDDIRVTLPETLTRIGVNVEGSTIRPYINGVEILPDKEQPNLKVQARFARGNVLRVTLGGLTEDERRTVRPVYLSRVRIAAAAPVTAAAVIPVAIPAANTETIRGLVANAVTGIVAGVGPQGDASVSWSALQGATSYFVVRWKIDDAACCKNFSPPQGMNRLDWADGVLPMAGTYAYRVYATTSSGILVGETTVAYQPVLATPPPGGGGVNRTGVDRSSIPAPRTIGLREVTAIGGYGSILPRAIDLGAVAAIGPFAAIAPHTIPLAAIQAVGSVRSTARTGVSVAPEPRTIALAELLGSGGFGAIKPKTIALSAMTASGGFAIPRPRTITLTGFTAAGTSRTP